MSYAQIQTADGVIARRLGLSADAKIDGYPGYIADITGNRGAVRTVLYIDERGIYVDETRAFHLTRIGDNGPYVFTSNPQAPYIPVQEIAIGIYPWSEQWANMRTDSPLRDGLIWPLNTAQSVLEYIARNRLRFSILSLPFDEFPSGAWLDKSSTSDRLRWDLNKTQFTLISRSDGYTLRTDAGEYAACWSVYGSCRLILTPQIANAVFFDMTYQGNSVFQFSAGGRNLTRGGSWIVGFFQVETNGAEFFSGNPPIPVRIIVNDERMSDRDLYLLSGNIVSTRYATTNEPWVTNPINVRENLPRGGGACVDTQWEGYISSCYGRRIPYTPSLGSNLCTTLADFSNDLHCQEWAITNRGERMDALLQSLCTNDEALQSLPQEQRAVCNCFRPDAYYYNLIRQDYLARHDDVEATRAANAIRRSNLLQCASGLCPQDGSFSSQVFYRDGRRCDVCIQVASVNVSAGNISDNVRVVQRCTQTDITFTWQDLISRLEALGAYRIGRGGNYRNVIINVDGSAIKLITSSQEGRQALMRFPLLRTLPRDAVGDTTLTYDRWVTNNQSYSREVLEFFFESAPDG